MGHPSTCQETTCILHTAKLIIRNRSHDMRTTGPIEVIARHRNSRRVAWLVLTLAALVAIGTLSGCETSTAATNAATQLSKVSQQLSDYYADLSNQVDDTIALNQVQAELLGLPFDDSDHARLNTTKQEIGKRAAMAKALGALASAYATLAGSKSAADIGTAASGSGERLHRAHSHSRRRWYS